ncbi:MAG: hypothetical protein Q7S60_02425 [bacterium]|nr:hypothetical protein [bacterium]
MKIIISAHFDVARPVMSILMDKQKISGLIDNLAGLFAAYEAGRKTGVPVYFTNFEEMGYEGAKSVAKGLDKKDTLVIVVDTCTDVKGKAAYIGNAYHLKTGGLKKEFKGKILFKDGLFEEDMDETYVYGGKAGLKTFFFGIPISGEYHDTDNEVALKTVDRSAEVLIHVIQWLQRNPA